MQGRPGAHFLGSPAEQSRGFRGCRNHAAPSVISSREQARQKTSVRLPFRGASERTPRTFRGFALPPCSQAGLTLPALLAFLSLSWPSPAQASAPSQGLELEWGQGFPLGALLQPCLFLPAGKRVWQPLSPAEHHIAPHPRGGSSGRWVWHPQKPPSSTHSQPIWPNHTSQPWCPRPVAEHRWATPWWRTVRVRGTPVEDSYPQDPPALALSSQ